ILTLVSDVTFTNGTIKVLVGTTVAAVGYGPWNGTGVVPSGCPIVWSAPGTKVMFVSGATNPGAPSIGGPTLSSSPGYNMVKAFTVLDTYTDSAGNFCVDTDMLALPSTSITVTGSIAIGTGTLVFTGISPADALPCVGMTIVGGDLPVGTLISGAVGAPNTASPVNTGTYTLSNSSAAGQPGGTTFTVSDTRPYFCQHPCPRLTASSITGGTFASDWSGAPPDIPMFSYFKRAFSGFPYATYFGQSQFLSLTGNLTSL